MKRSERGGTKPPSTHTLADRSIRASRQGFAALLFLIALGVAYVASLGRQIESVETSPQHFVWVSHGRVEGHLALTYSPAGGFSPDSSTLAAVNEGRVVLMDLAGAGVRKVLHVRVPDVTDLAIQSANFLAPNRLLILGRGRERTKDKGLPLRTPLLAFQWNTDQDALLGKVNAVGVGGGFGPPRYFPQIRYLGLYKEGTVDLWNPVTGHGGRITIPSLTRQPNLYEFSPDGQWLLLAQIEASSTADPVVVQLSDHQFVDSLRGHQGTVLSMAFSRNDKKAVTACEDGKVRIWSVPEWKLLQTLSGHQRPVHWAEFSADGSWVASAGEDRTVRIWSAEDGKLAQTLEESQSPLLTVAFSSNSEFVAASSEDTVLVWERRRAD